MGFFNNALYKQETAQTIKEAEENMDFTCNRCIKAIYCEESKCGVMQAHEARVKYLKAKENYQKTCTSCFVKTRKYNISQANLLKKKALSYLSKLSKSLTEEHYKTICIFDDASVQIEMGDYQNAICILKKNGFDQIAEHLEAYK